MARQKWNQSIVGRIRGMGRRIVIALITPVIVSLTLMLVFAGRYYRSVERMGAIAALKPVVPSAQRWGVVREYRGGKRIFLEP